MDTIPKYDLKKQISEIENKIVKLQGEKYVLLEELKKHPLALEEQVNNVLNYGREGMMECFSDEHYLIEDYLSGRYRHETIEVSDMVECILENNMCDNYEDQLEIELLFGNKNFTEEMYIRGRSFHVNYGSEFTPKEDFYDLAKCLIEKNIKSFEYDW